MWIFENAAASYFASGVAHIAQLLQIGPISSAILVLLTLPSLVHILLVLCKHLNNSQPGVPLKEAIPPVLSHRRFVFFVLMGLPFPLLFWPLESTVTVSGFGTLIYAIPILLSISLCFTVIGLCLRTLPMIRERRAYVGPPAKRSKADRDASHTREANSGLPPLPDSYEPPRDGEQIGDASRVDIKPEEHFEAHGEVGPLATPRLILEIPLSGLTGTTINPDEGATPCRFRFLDCAAFIDSSVLCVIEYPEESLREISFAAVSYPWRDLQMPEGITPPEGSFGVRGAEHADEISIDVLRTACLAARRFGRSLLWIDRLCILQTRKDDKNWQIQRMFRIYSRCDPCLVLPGGLVRLAALSDPTTWIDRAWTLQEALAPGQNKLKCLFSFTHTSYLEFLEQQCESGFGQPFLEFLCHSASRRNPIQTIIEPGRSAACDLIELFVLMWGGVAGFKYHEPALSRHHDRFPVRIIYTPAARLLQRALQFGGRYTWIAAFARSSSRPVDMVFSMMDLLGVNLEVSQFHPEERTKAMIHLLQASMNRGERATWLYISPEMPASVELSTLPSLPETSESGRAFIRTPDRLVPAFEAVEEPELWQSEGAPRGTMSSSGYFRFCARAVLVVGPRKLNTRASSHSGTATTRAYDNREVWAIVIGRREELNRDPETGRIRPTPRSAAPPIGVTELTFMFVENHGFGLFHRIGMEREINEAKTVDWDWKWREFDVGGPGRGERVRFNATPAGPTVMCESSEVARHKARELMRHYDERNETYVIHH
ncbi:hypothetical protein BOTBODRAFT_178061 [Botryobasidium botryosum FD-172 SS1]|uniref:Heterokaryon incompatibility domain-containing protein n=1 Tax=Botryobasidium botryosum (strain FD-172 SS1) TaxID=930990 RepID=A0A067MFB8_BOTB1|nr:hypothetical protein BOTBODRAFT_178061 [Botryobasidium botryosum FD-172 SS1]